MFSRIYLSGGMEYASNEGRDWRRAIEEWLTCDYGCSVFNPNQESDRLFKTRYGGVDFRRLKHEDSERYRSIVAELVDIDCHEIAERSDLVLCYWDASAQRGAGTKGELTMARYFGKPVYLVTTIPVTEIPGWVLGCTTRIFSSFDAVKEELRKSAPARE